MNKYEKWYAAITENAKHRTLESYTESHHILPRSLGGSDAPDNLVDLTAREHFICHWLLTKFTTGEDRWKMLNALRMMRAVNQNQQRYDTKITARVYEKLKKEYSTLQSKLRSGEGNGMFGKRHTEEAKEKIRKAHLGSKLTEEQIEKVRQSKLGKKRPPFSAEWRQKMSKAGSGENNSRYGAIVSEETRKKIGDAVRGRKHTEEEKKRRADAIRGSKREKKLCPHCQQLISVNTYPRWHGDRCKNFSG
jgi:hypothetical protein